MLLKDTHKIIHEIPKDAVRIEEIKGKPIENLYYAHSTRTFYLWNPTTRIGRELEKSKNNGITVHSPGYGGVRIPYKKWVKHWELEHSKE